MPFAAAAAASYIQCRLAQTEYCNTSTSASQLLTFPLRAPPRQARTVGGLGSLALTRSFGEGLDATRHIVFNGSSRMRLATPNLRCLLSGFSPSQLGVGTAPNGTTEESPHGKGAMPLHEGTVVRRRSHENQVFYSLPEDARTSSTSYPSNMGCRWR